MPRYEKPADVVRFGDLFKADSFFDAFLKADAVQLGSHPMGDDLRKRLASQYNRPELREAVGALAFSGLLPKKPEHDYLLVHGRPCRAVLVSDDCEIEAAYGRSGEEPSGRLLFAAIRDATQEEVEDLIQSPSFAHFPLPSEDAVTVPGIADLKRLFMMATRDVSPAMRFASLSDDSAEDLAVAWAAYATRHGPLPGLKNAEKLATLLAGGRDATAKDAERRAGQLVSELVNLAWLLEGEALTTVSEAFEGSADRDQAVDRVINVVEELGGRAAEALEALKPYASKTTQ